MPFINIRLAGGATTQAQRNDLFETTTTLMREIMGKNPAVTVVTIDEVSPSHWAVGGKTLDPSSGAAAYVDIKITRGTNTPEQKQRMLAASVAMFNRVFASLASPTYVVIHELDSNAWGYDGSSQAQRLAAARVSPPA